jgi:hydroxymethylglutaryl-CoA lyase
VSSVGFPLSVNETFQQRNLGRSLASSWELVERLVGASAGHGLELVLYLSMGFGNPYGDPWSAADTAVAVARARDLGVHRIALADTVGRADGAAVSSVLSTLERVPELGLHLHARPDGWQPLVAAGVAAGIRWFEGALSGVGGCPFAGDALVGNLPTEHVLPWLAARGGDAGVVLEALPVLAADAASIAEDHAADL